MISLTQVNCLHLTVSCASKIADPLKTEEVEYLFLSSLRHQHHHSPSLTVTDLSLHLSTTRAFSGWRALWQDFQTQICRPQQRPSHHRDPGPRPMLWRSLWWRRRRRPLRRRRLSRRPRPPAAPPLAKFNRQKPQKGMKE
jgi:hypothetical protein